MDFDALLKSLGRGDIKPVYLLLGPERLLMRRAVEAVRRAALGDGPRDFNEDVFRASESRIEDVVRSARTLPMMAERRVVILWEIERLRSAAVRELAAAVKDPSPTTCLILAGQEFSKKEKENKELVAAVDKAGVAYSFAELKDREIPAWVRKIADEKGVRLGAEAVSAFAKAVGGSLDRIEQEMEKIALYAPEGKSVSVRDVEEVVLRVREESMFHLTDAVALRQAGPALEMLGKMLEDGEEPIGINSMIYRQFRNLIMAREMMDRKAKAEDILGALGVRFFQDKFLAQTRNFTVPELTDRIRSVSEADLSLKAKSRLPKRLVMERLILELCKDANPAERPNRP